jgi:hypothetical protein
MKEAEIKTELIESVILSFTQNAQSTLKNLPKSCAESFIVRADLEGTNATVNEGACRPSRHKPQNVIGKPNISHLRTLEVVAAAKAQGWTIL